MFQYSPPQSPTHVCGLYYVVPVIGCHVQKHFLPQVKLEAKATILSTTSQTLLTQTFVNPSREKGIRECRYTFPLYDGVSVVGFTCQIGERKIVGQVKEREKAKAVFNEAVARGETAGLLEQLSEASDVFSTTVGNIPPGAKVIIDITYLGELKHDMEIDGIRFTIPNIIYPRYGDYPGTLQRSLATDAMGRSISITVDAEMADGSFIQKIQSPTHPIAVTMGTTSVAPNADPAMTKASATLTLGTAGLQTDFVLQVIAKDTGVPKAILENHPRIPNQRALMATLVPKFVLPPEKPEIVFICDRSGSMGGSRIELAKQALKVFLKSLPVGVKFNICSFGWRHTFLWPRSVTYSQQTLDEAMRHADTFLADYGGTIMLEPLKATIQQRYQDMPLDIMLLTDGEDWNQQNMFSYLNETIIDTKAPIRVFTLGIGNGVSHAMIEGIAKAGNGFSQAVGEGEAMNTKVVRMLKGALSPHINDYTLEVKYNNDEVSAHLDVEPEDDFEIIEKASDSLIVKIDFRDEKVENDQTKKPISLFDSTVDPDKEEEPEHDETGENRYAHLPKLPVPNIIQAPQNIPSLFAFHRASVYLLLGPGAPQGTPTSVILRGTSAHGPLELEIPIQVLDKPGETIHQLAAKKAISELEQGRGWLKEAKDESDTLIKKKFEGRYNDMVEREAVRLGVQFQVGGKWCSFVAVEAKHKEAEEQKKNAKEWQWLEDEGEDTPQDQQPMTQPAVSNNGIGARYTMNPPGWNNNAGLAARTPAAAFPSMNLSNPSPFQNTAYGSMPFSSAGPGSSSGPGSFAFGQVSQSGGSLFGAPTAGGGVAFGASNSMSSGGLFGSSSTQNSGGLFGSSNPNPTAPFGTANSSGSSLFGAPAASRGASFGSFSSTNSNVFNNTASSSNSQLFGSTGTTSASTFGAPAQQQSHTGSSLFGAPNTSSQGKSELEQYQMGLMVLRQENKKRNLMARQEYDNTQSNQVSKGSLFGDVAPPSSSRVSGPLSGETLLHHLISLQSFSGSWSLTPELLETLDLDPARVRAEMDAVKLDGTVFATALVIAIFEERLAAWKGSWELVVEKAQGWLQEQVAGEGDDAVDRCLKCARKVWD